MQRQLLSTKVTVIGIDLRKNLIRLSGGGNVVRVWDVVFPVKIGTSYELTLFQELEREPNLVSSTVVAGCNPNEEDRYEYKFPNFDVITDTPREQLLEGNIVIHILETRTPPEQGYRIVKATFDEGEYHYFFAYMDGIILYELSRKKPLELLIGQVISQEYYNCLIA